jgi:hypothetical protein
MSRVLCVGCGKSVASLNQHWAKSPNCQPAAWEMVESSDYSEEPDLDEVLGPIAVSQDQLSKQVAQGLAKIIIFHGVHHTAVQQFVVTMKTVLEGTKRLVMHDVVAKSWQQLRWNGPYERVEEIYNNFAPLLEPKFDIFKGLSTTKTQLAFIMKMLPYVEPVATYLGERAATWKDSDGTVHVVKEKAAYVHTVSIAEQCINKFNYAPDDVRAHMLACSRTWAQGTKHLALDDVRAQPSQPCRPRHRPRRRRSRRRRSRRRPRSAATPAMERTIEAMRPKLPAVPRARSGAARPLIPTP